MRRLLLALLLSSHTTGAWAQSRAPKRQIPTAVLDELRLLENRFDLALAADCDPSRCFAKGCTYVDHAVTDRKRTTSLPGLVAEEGPGSVEAQEYLTRAVCSFAHEESVTGQDVQTLVRRLQLKLSKGWLAVSVERAELQPLPEELRQPPVPEPPPEPELPPPPPVPEAWSASVAWRQLWATLLPHAAWMVALVLGTLAAISLVWAWRRVGRESFEERALLAELERGDAAAAAPAEEAADEESEDERAFAERQEEAWGQRLAELDPADPDPELQALVRELLRSGDLPLLAKAVLKFPDTFLAAFPAGGDIATAKLELAAYLKDVDASSLPPDADFFRALNRHALAAALASQSDAQVVRSLREEFGASGLVTLIGSLPARAGALVYALAPADEQHEMARLLSTRQMAELADPLLRSNRMDSTETAYLFAVLRAARDDAARPPAPEAAEVSDRGTEFDAAAALSVLLSRVDAAQRGALFGGALQRLGGSLPAWYRGILVPDMLLRLDRERRADLLLEVDVETLSAWLSLQTPEVVQHLLDGVPGSLRASVQATSVFPSRARQLALAERGRRDLARGFQGQLARAAIPFERVVQPRPAEA